MAPPRRSARETRSLQAPPRSSQVPKPASGISVPFPRTAQSSVYASCPTSASIYIVPTDNIPSDARTETEPAEAW